MKFILALIKTYFTVTSTLFPKFAERQAFELFQKTAKRTYKPHETEFYSTAKKFTVPSDNGPVHCYEIGNPNGELVLLVHGWNSNAGSLSGIGQELASKGYRVVSFDLPAHGKSPEKRTNLLYCRMAMDAVLKHLNVKNPLNVVAHSFGSLVSSYSLNTTDIPVKNMVLLTTPNKVTTIFRDFAKTIGLSNKTYELMVAHAEQLLEESLEDLTVLSKLKKVNPEQLVLIHDHFDKMLPHANSEFLAQNLPNTTLYSFEKIGHYRMLWNETVIDRVMKSIEKKEAEISTH